jgi:hypothetical protein
VIWSYGRIKLGPDVSFMCLSHCVFAQELFDSASQGLDREQI